MADSLATEACVTHANGILGHAFAAHCSCHGFQGCTGHADLKHTTDSSKLQSPGAAAMAHTAQLLQLA